MKKPAVLSFCIVLVFCMAATFPAMGASDEEAVLQVAENWARAFNTSDLNLMSSLLWNSPEV